MVAAENTRHQGGEKNYDYGEKTKHKDSLWQSNFKLSKEYGGIFSEISAHEPRFHEHDKTYYRQDNPNLSQGQN